MNRIFHLWAVVAATCCLLSISQSGQADQPRFTVVCSTTQVADFARQVVGDDWRVESILAAGQDPHLYEPTVRDAQLVSRASLCLDNGWNLEGHEWLRRLAQNAGKPIVSCIEGVEPIYAEEGDEEVRDPHAWMNPRNAAIYVRNVVRAVSEIDPDNAARFEMRAGLYLGQLRALHTWIQSETSRIPASRRVLVTHHDAFAYFAKEYGFRAVSPGGWTTEELAGISIGRRQEVVDTIRRTGVRSIFVETALDPRMINQIAREAGVEIGGTLYADAMGPAGSAAETYIGMMRENVITIVSGLKE